LPRTVGANDLPDKVPHSLVFHEEFWFEGTRFFTTGIGCPIAGYETGIYEVEMLEDDNLKFTVI